MEELDLQLIQSKAKASQLEDQLKAQPDEMEAMKSDIDSLLNLNRRLEDSVSQKTQWIDH